MGRAVLSQRALGTLVQNLGGWLGLVWGGVRRGVCWRGRNVQGSASSRAVRVGADWRTWQASDQSKGRWKQ
jgi:hypothetical protein